MARSPGRYLSLETVLLCLVELVISFTLIYAVLVTSAGPEAVRPSAGRWLHPETANLAAMLAFSVAAISASAGLYRPGVPADRRRLLLYAGLGGAIVVPLLLAVSGALQLRPNLALLLWLAKVALAWAGCVLASRAVFALAVRHGVFARPVLILGGGPRADRLARLIRGQRGRLFELAGRQDPAEDAAFALPENRRIWAVVVAGGCLEKLPVPALLACKLKGVQVLDDLSFLERHLGRIDLDNTPPGWLVFADGFSSSAFADAVRRAADVAVSLVFLLCALPLMLLVAGIIKLDSSGPVFYRQERVGLHGRVFTLFKFRSMRVDAEAEGKPRWAQQNDPRVTRIGAFIRSTRIDELPQLINVLRGEMSFIGPRPERPLFVDELARVIPLYEDRTWVKPGITGWAQVNFPYGASVEDAREKLAYDLYYVKNRSLFLDLLILTSTIRVILFREGAR
jgi:sugar transferase (PEP-CTERM system associated)